jgi:hypothetical protein
VAGGPGAEVVGNLLAATTLPQLAAVLRADALAAQLDARALLRLLKAFLQARAARARHAPGQQGWCGAAGGEANVAPDVARAPQESQCGWLGAGAAAGAQRLL